MTKFNAFGPESFDKLVPIPKDTLISTSSFSVHHSKQFWSRLSGSIRDLTVGNSVVGTDSMFRQKHSQGVHRDCNIGRWS